jgi:very-short-patch-repair endonuclease
MSRSARLLPGVFIGSHAIAEGLLTRGQLRTRSYRRLVQGVYADPALEVDHRLRCRGVALLLPSEAVIGGHSAAAWYGAPFAGSADPVTVLRPEEVRWNGPRGVRVHRTTLARGDLARVDDVPISSALRTAWDVAALEPLPTAAAEAGAGRFGVTRFRRALPLVDPRAESAPESRVRVALALAGLAPEPQCEVFCGGRFIARVDFGWPAARLALEYEGAHHLEGMQIVRDDARLARLVAAGWRVLRISAADLRDLDAVVTRVREALAAS